MTNSKPEKTPEKYHKCKKQSEPNYLADMAKIIESTAKAHKVSGKVKEIHSGPTITTFTFDVNAGTPVIQVKRLDSWLARALFVPSIQITKESSSEDRFFLEIPNLGYQAVQFSDLVVQPDFLKVEEGSILFGVDADGKSVISHLKDLPHLLVAGNNCKETEQLINSVIHSLFIKTETCSTKVLLIDPKASGFYIYKDHPHLLAPVVFSVEKAVTWLQWVDAEIETRIQKMAEGLSQIALKWNEKGSSGQPPILIIIRELADLVTEAREVVTRAIERITKYGGSVGIHLIVATQCPSETTIPEKLRDGSISQFVFQTSSRTESIVTLGIDGAEKLLGVGDGFLRLSGGQSVSRVYIPDL